MGLVHPQVPCPPGLAGSEAVHCPPSVWFLNTPRAHALCPWQRETSLQESRCSEGPRFCSWKVILTVVCC